MRYLQVGLSTSPRCEHELADDLHDQRRDVAGLDTQPLLHQSALLDVLWDQAGAVGEAIIEILADGAGLIQNEIPVNDGGNHAPRLVLGVGRLLVFT